MEIRSKLEFFSLWEAGVLGNRTRLWRDPQEAYRWGMQRDIGQALKTRGKFTGTQIGFREIRKPGSTGAGKWQKVPWPLVIETAQQWKSEGREFVMDDGVPNEKQTLMGEIVRTERGMEGFLTLATPLPMRPAMAAGLLTPRGYLETRLLLSQYMDASSQDDLDALLEMYPDAAIEFSCFSVKVGIFKKNTLFWEVRNY